ncbi:vanadium-dependent haloperoxidase [Pseudocnuella soli]|uniref:vanadium-dependent haloperoxidase n=1 Tax=Pseudocnuella soli TaxID=2502779 RepID=UPI00104C001A|nr:vanadium-dependent haloperoxidase [Pseudocnuella soli]
MKPTTNLLVATIITFFLIGSCKKPYDFEQVFEGFKKPNNPGFAANDMVLYWNEKTATVLASPMIQPARARLFAIVEIAVHDALNNIKPKYEAYALDAREQFADPDAAVASAAYWTIKGLNSQGNSPIDSWYEESLATIPDGRSKELGKTLGKKAADAIFANRANDGLSQVVQTSQTPADGTLPGAYRSTLMLIGGNLTPTTIKRIPNWGTVMKPFVLKNNEQFRPSAPYAVTSAQYATDFNEVKTKGGRVGGTRTAAEEKQAMFWRENRPSVTWNNFVRAAIAGKKMDAWKTARLFALMHVSMAESINSQMNAGYQYYFWRPETAIRLAATDGNNATTPDPNWLPFLDEVPNVFPTPPVPGYPNGFAAYGGSTAEILRLFFESDETDIQFTSTTLPNEPIRFTSYSAAARQNSLSMIYTGWDFRKSVLEGEEMGKNIARYVFANAFISAD